MLGCSRLGVDILLLKRNTIDEKSIKNDQYKSCEYFKNIKEFAGGFVSQGFVEVAIDVK